METLINQYPIANYANLASSSDRLDKDR